MSDVPTTLVPKAMQEADLIREDAARLLDYVRERDCVSMALVIVHADGSTAVQKRSSRNGRAALLGAVTDLQFDIASDGNR